MARMFLQLEAEITDYNNSNSNSEKGGQAKLQTYQCPKDDTDTSDIDTDDTDTSDIDTDEFKPPPQKKLKLAKQKKKEREMSANDFSYLHATHGKDQ